MRQERAKSKKLAEDNQNLKLLVSSDSVDELAQIKRERDAFQKDNNDMRKFLCDYGLKWVGGEGG